MTSTHDVPLVFPIELKSDETSRLTWNGVYYSFRAALFFTQQAQTAHDICEHARNIHLVLKLVPFKSELRSKFLASLAPEKLGAGETPDTIYGMVVTANVESGEVLGFADVRRLANVPVSQDTAGTSAESEIISLSESDIAQLRQGLSEAFQKGLLQILREPFASFLPDLTEQWKSAPVVVQKKNTKDGPKETLVPYQMVFPQAIPVDRIVDGTRFILDDLYCTKPGCPCTDVTCIVLKLDQENGQEVAFGGFTYNLENAKFKPLPQFSAKFNASEWFKQFSKNHPFSLEAVLKSRYQFMRTQFIAERALAKA